MKANKLQLERYRQARMDKSHAEEMYRTAVYYMDKWYWWYKVKEYTDEVNEAFNYLY